jgi:hypothetical protein
MRYLPTLLLLESLRSLRSLRVVLVSSFVFIVAQSLAVLEEV